MSIQRAVCRWAEAATVALLHYTPIRGCLTPNEKLSMLLSYRITARYKTEDRLIQLESSTLTCFFDVYFFSAPRDILYYVNRICRDQHLAFKWCPGKALGVDAFES